jgi:hypothetical protein
VFFQALTGTVDGLKCVRSGDLQLDRRRHMLPSQEMISPLFFPLYPTVLLYTTNTKIKTSAKSEGEIKRRHSKTGKVCH